jgi:3-deoxy-D-manno-octulosonate 8-phosphate phosphatase (KDO 8-P phosphatase)
MIADDGQLIRTSNIKDGFALRAALAEGYHIAIISGGKNEIVRRRFNLLGITDIYLGISDKLPKLKQWMAKTGLGPDEIAYMGDDIADVRCMNLAGLAAAPCDAAPEALEGADFISKAKGGEGCVRDLIECVMRAQSRWPGIDTALS